MSQVQSPKRNPPLNDRRQTARAGELTPAQDIMDYFKEYARERPEVVALWCFGLGFVLGWKLKPW